MYYVKQILLTIIKKWGGVKYCVGKIPLYDVAFLSLKKKFF